VVASVAHTDPWRAAHLASAFGVADPGVRPGKPAALLRDLFGPLPFRLVATRPGWLTPSAVNLARAIYEEQAFDRLPVLSDALEEAGCDNQESLQHGRGPGPHCRGCWVLDLILSKDR